MVLMVGLLLVFLCLFIICRAATITINYYWLQPRHIRKMMANQGVHGPKPQFLTGNLIEVASVVSKANTTDMDSISHDIVGRLLPHYVLWSKQYGKRFIYWVGSEPRMCMTETEMIKELFSLKYTLLSGRSWMQEQGSKHFVGRGLLMASKDDWYHQRHVVAPVFMGQKLKRQVGSMVECTKQMIESLEALIGSGKTEIDVGELMTQLTADIISRTQFGASSEKGKQIIQHLTSLQHSTAQSSRHLCLPGSRFYPTKSNREIKSLNKKVEKLFVEIIQGRKDGVETGRSDSYGNDLLGMLMAETQKKRDGKTSFDLQLLIDQCKTIFFAGHETTALHLTWTIMLLASNPSWQNKVRAEVFNVCNCEAPSTDHLPKLTLMNMVMNESLRLYPPVSIIPRTVFEDIKLGDLHIPKGLSIWIPVLAIHHSEELWGKDVNEFKPDRFAAKSFEMFMPFSSGPRNCVGQTFAVMEAKIILAMLITKFDFTISENYRHAPVSIISLKPKHGVQIILKPLSP